MGGGKEKYKSQKNGDNKQKSSDKPTSKLHPSIQAANDLRTQFSSMQDIPVPPQPNYRGKFVPMGSDDTAPMAPCSPGMLRSVANAISGYGWDAAGLAAQAGYWSILAPLEWLQRTIAPVRGAPVNADGTPTRVAIIGAGASGLSCAWALHQTEGFDFHVFEAADVIGGHAFTIPFKTGKDGEVTVPCDLGFIFGNHRSYSNLLEIMASVGAEATDVELSLQVDVDGIKWCTSTSGYVLGHDGPCRMTKDQFAECTRFHDLANRFAENAALNLIPFGWVMDQFGFAQKWRDVFLNPVFNILFLDVKQPYNMSARFIFNVFGGLNQVIDLRHGHRAFTVKNGTRDIWHRVTALFLERIHTNHAVMKVRRFTNKHGKAQVGLTFLTGGEEQIFDHCVMCCNGKVCEKLLTKESSLEKFVFSHIRYNTETLTLHKDKTMMPESIENSRVFNYIQIDGAHPCMVGNCASIGNHPIAAQARNGHPMTDTVQPFAMSGSIPGRKIKKEDVIATWTGSLHQQDLRHLIVTRVMLPMIEGAGNVWYGASWCNFMGHAGAADAGIACAVRLGANCPLKGEDTRRFFFNMACQDLFGPRFDWETSVRKHKPLIRSAL